MAPLWTLALLGGVALPGLAACLSTPPGGLDADAAPVPLDSAAPRCAAGECEQLLAIGLWRHEPVDGSSVALLRRDTVTGTWTRLADAPGSPDGNIFDLAWGDCCGPSGLADGLPDLVAANFYGLYISQLRRPVDAIGVTPFVAPSQPDIPAVGVQSLWTDVDGDGDLDILSGHPSLRWFPTSTAGIASPLMLDAAVGRLSLGSWDDDPEPEVVITDRRQPGGRGVVVVERDTGAWTTFVPLLDELVDTVLWCDLYDAPGLDLVVEARSDADNVTSMRIFPNRGSAIDGNWLDMIALRTIAVPMGSVPPMVCGDLDDDGGDDLLVVTSSGLRVVFHGTTTATLLWNPAATVAASAYITDLVLADLDHDGPPEVLVTLGDDAAEEAVAESVAYLLPNQTAGVGQVALGPPVSLLSARVDGLSLAFTEFMVAPAP